jgi:hypothetical protein
MTCSRTGRTRAGRRQRALLLLLLLPFLPLPFLLLLLLLLFLPLLLLPHPSAAAAAAGGRRRAPPPPRRPSSSPPSGRGRRWPTGARPFCFGDVCARLFWGWAGLGRNNENTTHYHTTRNNKEAPHIGAPTHSTSNQPSKNTNPF